MSSDALSECQDELRQERMARQESNNEIGRLNVKTAMILATIYGHPQDYMDLQGRTEAERMANLEVIHKWVTDIIGARQQIATLFGNFQP